MAWVLMPDHFHALIRLGASESLASVMQRINSLTARAANSASGENGQVWQSTYHDRALRKDEELHVVSHYVVANPVRARLVARIGDYPYWNATLPLL